MEWCDRGSRARDADADAGRRRNKGRRGRARTDGETRDASTQRRKQKPQRVALAGLERVGDERDGDEEEERATVPGVTFDADRQRDARAMEHSKAHPRMLKSA